MKNLFIFDPYTFQMEQTNADGEDDERSSSAENRIFKGFPVEMRRTQGMLLLFMPSLLRYSFRCDLFGLFPNKNSAMTDQPP